MLEVVVTQVWLVKAEISVTPAPTPMSLRTAEGISSSPTLSVAPVPRRPDKPRPQQRAVLSEKTAQECPSPRLTLTAVFAGLAKLTAPTERIGSSSPTSCRFPYPLPPKLPRPQQKTSPSSTAQVPKYESTDWIVRPPVSENGPTKGLPLAPTSVAEPIPSRPADPRPQHRSRLPESRTQVDDNPAWMESTKEAVSSLWSRHWGVACRGASDAGSSAETARTNVSSLPIESRVPYPKRPSVPRPQHLNLPSRSTAQTCQPPAAASTAYSARGLTPPGRVFGVSSSPTDSLCPRPSCPSKFSPQHCMRIDSKRAQEE